jgi:hypothetical protein
MIAFKVLFICLQAIKVVGQTPSGFTPAVTQTLEIRYGANEVSPAGKQIARAGKVPSFRLTESCRLNRL